jgi:hypothetical protein
MRLNQEKFASEKYASMTDLQIKQQSAEEGKASCLEGTKLHKEIEDFYNCFMFKKNLREVTLREYYNQDKKIISKETPTKTYFDNFLIMLDEFNLKHVVRESSTCSVEFLQFLNFVKDTNVRLEPYRTEWSIYIEELNFAGQLDILFEIKGTNTCALYDWKRTKEIKFENKFEKGNGCLSHLDNCNFVHYSLQLNLYKYILENYYSHKGKKMEVAEMAIVVFHPNNDSYQLLKVNSMPEEVCEMLKVLKNK